MKILWSILFIFGIVIVGVSIAYFFTFSRSTDELTDLRARGLVIRTHTGGSGGLMAPQAALLNIIRGPDLSKLSPEELRKKKLLPSFIVGRPIEVASVKDQQIPGPGGDIPIRVHTPEGEGPFPVMVYFHGGGWTFGSIEARENITTRLAKASEAIVVSVAYRLAPEHPFPAGLEDAYTAVQWVVEHATSFNGTQNWIAVAGDSSGGNLAAAVALMARDRGGPKLAYQFLIYPGTSLLLDTPSVKEHGDLATNPQTMLRYFREQYIKDPADWKNPYASPLLAEDLSGLPPALIITAEFDTLRDEGEWYGQRLHQAGVPVTVTRYVGLVHGFLGMQGFFPRAARQAIEEMATTLQANFAKQKTP